MARRKIDLVLRIIEIILGSPRSQGVHGHGLSTEEYHTIRKASAPQLQLRLQKLRNDRLRIILEQLEDGLICRHWNFSSRKYDCPNDKIGKDSCSEHTHTIQTTS